MKPTKPTKPTEPKSFPFNKLPAEIKNEIYDLALIDKNGIHLIFKIQGHRRIVRRDLPNFSNSTSYRHRRVKDQIQATDSAADIESSASAKLPKFLLNILLLNREINAETRSTLYGGNHFIFEDPAAMYTFLATIGPQNRAVLTDLTVKGWNHSRATKMMNYPALTMMADAVKLQHLHMDCKIHDQTNGEGPPATALQIYRDGFLFLQNFGFAHKKFDAAIEIIEIAPENFISGEFCGRDPDATHAEHMEEFREELRKLLTFL